MNKDINPASGLSIAGLAIGASAVFLFWVPLVHFILVVLSTIFGAIALSRKEKFGLSGLLLGLLSYCLVAVYYIFIIAYAVTLSV